MIFFMWKEEYLTHVKELDEQHRKLVELINNLYADLLECQNNDQKQSLVNRLLEELIEYSVYHFTAEENLLLQYEYPRYELHVEEHERFKSQVAQFMKDQSEAERALPFPLVVFLRDWLISHVLTEDKQYGPYLCAQMRLGKP